MNKLKTIWGIVLRILVIVVGFPFIALGAVGGFIISCTVYGVALSREFFEDL